MFLKSISLHGFKSFPDRYEIVMTDRITGIVGPNGSGKSNIGDAVRWVLGEQSAKSMRGDKMEDVIFNGTQLRKPKGYCEVSLLFENVTQRVMPDCVEIEVTRKLYRSGESEYLINQKLCRLRDILELFRDTGIGKEGYSIIGQGKIDEILTEKSTARRRVFEEASGIMKYRVRKEEAERKLEKTGENLTRISDILFEINNQLEPLKEQSENTKEFLKLSDRQKHLEVGIYLFSIESSNQRELKLGEELKGVHQQILDKQEEISSLDATFHSEKERITLLDESIATLNEQLLLKREGVEKQKGEHNLLNFKRDNLIEELKKCTLEQERITQELAELSDVLADDELENINTSIAQTLEKQKSLTEKLELESKNVTFFDQDIEEVQTALFSLLNELSAINSEIAGLSSRRESLFVKNEEQGEQKTKLEQTLKTLSTSIEELNKNKTAITEELSVVRSAINGATLNLNEQNKEYEKLNAHYIDVQKQNNQFKARLNALHELEQSHEGYFEGVKQLLKLKDTHQTDKVLCTVAQAIESEAKFEKALEAVLGAALQNIIVENEYDAKDLINKLRQNNWGRATFLPLNALNIKYLSNQEKNVLNGSGIYGVASEIVSCRNEYRRAIEFLLARTVIVEDMDVGISLMRKAHQSFRIVTLSGDILNPGGAISGGSTNTNKSGLLSRGRLIEEQNEKIVASNRALEKLSREMEACSVVIKEIKEKRNTALEEIHTLELKNTSVMEKLEALKKEQNQLNMQIQQIEATSNSCVDELDKCDLNLEKLKIKQDAINSMQLEKNLHLSHLEKQYSGKSDETEQLREDLQTINMELSALQKDLALRTLEKETKLKERERLTATLAGIETRIREATEELNQTESEILQLLLTIEVSQQQNDEELDVLKQKSAEKAALNAQISDKTTFAGKLNEELSTLKERQLRLEMNIERTVGEREALFERMWEEYELTLNNAQQYKLQTGITAARDELSEVKESIRNLGAINPNAVEEYDRLQERFEELSTQRDDLSSARDDLQTVISELLNKMQTTFMEGLKTINNNFKDAFSELFGGGRADLILLDEGNVMESGIDIVAEPPGKKLQSVSLLSGGEKAMTAIALLFAMQKINPSPVCILDEIDAALDDYNLSKYLEYIKRYSSSVQFLIVTHRKLSMSACNVLYGVAMEEKGVSKILSVKIGESA